MPIVRVLLSTKSVLPPVMMVLRRQEGIGIGNEGARAENEV
jgi:hypothetical protein